MSDTNLPNGLIAFGPNANCTLDICPLEWSILRYQPSIPANGTFIGLFALSMIVHAFQGFRTSTWGYMAAMLAGCLLEIIGYVGRLIIHSDPFNFSGFLMQIICITIAPVFYCSAIYVLLSQVIGYIDPSLSRFKPQLYYWVFIPADIISLILQATGGALSCTGGNGKAIDQGVDVSLAGLIFQVVTLTAFSCLFADYLIACSKSKSARRKMTRRLKIFLGFLFLSILFILIRCCYRIVELHEGYFSELFRDQPLFIAFESAVMCVTAFFLNIGHPGLGFQQVKPKKSLESDG